MLPLFASFGVHVWAQASYPPQEFSCSCNASIKRILVTAYVHPVVSYNGHIASPLAQAVWHQRWADADVVHL